MPFENLVYTLDPTVHLELEIPKETACSFIEKFQGILGDNAELVCLEVDNYRDQPNLYTYAVADQQHRLPDGQSTQMDQATYHALHTCVPTIILLETRTQTMFARLIQEALSHPTPTDYLGSAFYRGFIPFAQKTGLLHKSSLCTAVLNMEDIGFSDMTRLFALEHDTGAWEENGEQILQNSTASFRELIAFREDVFCKAHSSLLAKGIDGTGAALAAMRDVYRGKYRKDGVKSAMKPMLVEAGLPDWCIRSMEKIWYLFPKSHCISFLLRDLNLYWYAVHEPELYANVQREWGK